MGERPGPEYSIDGSAGTGSYEPGNCWWATAEEQRRYRVGVIKAKWRGEEVPLYQLARLRDLEPWAAVKRRVELLRTPAFLGGWTR
jgi:hypothetical protein